jgi:phosphoglucomutase
MDIIQKARDYIALEKHATFRKEIQDLLDTNAEQELLERFHVSLEFGTGGLRGIIGGGDNRMNPLVVRKATQGLATYIKKNSAKKSPSVVIAHDSRHYSDLFALEAALVLCGNGIKAYLYPSLRSTPQLSFSVRYLGAAAGIVITASHNPPQYNGYKVYWEDGGQIVAPHDTGIIDEAGRVGNRINDLSMERAKKEGLLEYLDDTIDAAFMESVKAVIIRKEMVRDNGRRLSVVYTPLHGSGAVPVKQVLLGMNIAVTVVPEQEQPDGNFPTVEKPNPEESSAMTMALELAQKTGADIVMGTDPDADRLGVAARHAGQYLLISGNRLGALLADYIFSSRKELGSLPPNPAFIKTIVTTELQRLIALKHGAQCFDVLTGFKYIGEKIRLFESTPGGPAYVFGGEESYGYLVGTEVRDKNAISAAAVTAEMALYHLLRGKTLIDRLDELFAEFGYFEETQISRGFEGITGAETMRALMRSLRDAPPRRLGGRPVVAMKDYLSGATTDLVSGAAVKNIDLPSSDVVQMVLDDGSIVTARPSGTEPKIKFYAMCREKAGLPLDNARENTKEKISAIGRDINGLVGRFS